MEENKVEKTKKYPDQYDTDYEGVWNVKDLFDEINEDYYQPIKTKIGFEGNYKEYENRGDKDENFSPQEYLNMIRPYLRDMINNHKVPLEDYSGNDNDPHAEWKIS